MKETAMPSFERHCDVTWEGPIREGKGEAIAGTGAFRLPVTFAARVEQAGGKTSPEELIAAAHAACYAMALTATMGRRNASARRLRVTATIEAEFEAGIKIKASHLKVRAEGLQDVTAADFPQLARDAEQSCPVSNALRGSLKIDVDAQAV
jgi:osmotically inducible protein OsmC